MKGEPVPLLPNGRSRREAARVRSVLLSTPKAQSIVLGQQQAAAKVDQLSIFALRREVFDEWVEFAPALPDVAAVTKEEQALHAWRRELEGDAAERGKKRSPKPDVHDDGAGSAAAAAAAVRAATLALQTRDPSFVFKCRVCGERFKERKGLAAHASSCTGKRVVSPEAAAAGDAQRAVTGNTGNRVGGDAPPAGHVELAIDARRCLVCWRASLFSSAEYRALRERVGVKGDGSTGEGPSYSAAVLAGLRRLLLTDEEFERGERGGKGGGGGGGGGESPRPSLRWAVILLRAGHFSAAVFDARPFLEREERRTRGGRGGGGGGGGSRRSELVRPILYKSFHRYTVRKKQGGGQGSHDSGGSGAAKSAGAQIRRYNERMLTEEISTLLRSEEWSKALLLECDAVFVGAAKGSRHMVFSPLQVRQRWKDR